MRWLQWSTIDLENGLGGVEVHARNLALELAKRGIETAFSRDPADLDDSKWDVIHTHGSAYFRRGGSAAIRIHTLHGTTLGRMAACAEWTWPGGYAAALRELRGVLSADVVLSVHPRLFLYTLAQRVGKLSAVCWNGWDSRDKPGEASPLGIEIKGRLEKTKPFWVYIGRGEDWVKGADRVREAMKLLPDLNWVAAPGSGFEDLSKVLKTGKLSSTQVRELVKLSNGLILPSRYEGYPLVLLEALSEGVPVVATKVGGMRVLPEGLEGLILADSGDARALADAVRGTYRFPSEIISRSARAEKNRTLLPTWEKVAEISLSAVIELQQRRGSKLKHV